MTNQQTRFQWKMASPAGNLYLVASAEGLHEICFSEQPRNGVMASSLGGPEPAMQVLREAVRQLDEYFAGRRRDFELPLCVQGTAFQERVWGELRKIPYGKTCSYSELAAKLNNPKAVRAVGGANGRNPLGIIVPCHRVIAADGSLGGYAGGLPMKEFLLRLESQ